MESPARDVHLVCFNRRALSTAQFLGSLKIVAVQLGDQRDPSGIDAGHQPITFPSLVVTHPQAAGATGETGYIHAR